MRLIQITATSLIVSLLILSTAASVLSPPSQSGLKSIMVMPTPGSSLAQYQESDALVITSNADFARLGATGVGTPSDPYIFENLFISTNNVCIDVLSTTAYFEIYNCKLESDATHSAILFRNVENGRVVQCEITGGASGVQIFNSLDCSVSDSLLYDCWNGMNLYFAANCSVYENTIHNNHRGILFESADHCEILNNSIYSNWEYGVEIAFYSSNNTIYGNSIGWNDVSGGEEENALDTGEDNEFDDGLGIGNFWSDYNESETYQIPGNTNSSDQFAQLLEDTNIPNIVPLYDTAIDVETTGNILTWTVTDLFPESYEIHTNEIQSISEIWNGGELTFGLDHLEVGAHTITLIVYDGAGNAALDEVFVSVVSFILGGIGTELVMIASGITVVCFVTIVLLVKKLS